MSDRAILSIVEGELTGKEYIFEDRTTCIIGRHESCQIPLPNDANHSTISRYHCLLDINPPGIRVRDFGSLNGTFINDMKIGQREDGQSPEEGTKIIFPEYDLRTGDRIKLGDTVFAVTLAAEPVKAKQPIVEQPIQGKGFDWIKIVENLLGWARQGDRKLTSIKDYKIHRELGKGGCGVVYLAEHQKTGQLVALKVMLPQVAATERNIESFLREIENTKILDHPNVVKLLDYGYANGTFFFTMDYYERGNLATLIAEKKGEVSIDLAVDLICQTLEGLDYAHNVEVNVKLKNGGIVKSKGLVHRDMKLQNIFLTRNNQNKLIAKVGDYGLSKAFDTAGLSGFSISNNVAGTYAYMPRQQLLNYRDVKPEVDIWATAACLYALLTCELPRDLSGDPLKAILSSQPIPIRNRNHTIPKNLAEVIDLALTEEPEIYYKTARDFRHSLLDCI
jgi:eukaryotic-like serine/threonine-protein kinase